MATHADGSFICAHEVDRSLLRQGFTLSSQMLYEFKSWFGDLELGLSRKVTVRLGGESYVVRVGNRNFDREKWPSHREMYQMRYDPGSEFAKTLRKVFSATDRYIADTLKGNPDLGKRHIAIPPSQHEQIVFYRTDDPLVWDAEVQTAEETQAVFGLMTGVDESLFESQEWKDESAGIVTKSAIVKARRIDRAIGDNLKRIYLHRCQVCGEQVALRHDAYVDEVHHIAPFVTSLNNDVSNLIVLCPNHHRIIHATHADFIRRRLAFRYPNGLEEGLSLNYHLKTA